MTTRTELVWARGGRAWLEHTDGHHVSVESEISAAPGTPLMGTFDGGALDGEVLQLKVRGCRRSAEEPLRFRIDGRFVNLSASTRARLLRALTSPNE